MTTIGRVQGKLISNLPKGLFIPEEALEVELSQFEGPLDLLLFMIRRQNLDISELTILPIAEQYLAYISKMKQLNIELASDYLLMAATLAEIKSFVLIPAQPDEQDGEDPRAELVEKLRVYQKIKSASDKLDKIPRLHREWHEVVVSVSKPSSTAEASTNIEEIHNTYSAILRYFSLKDTYKIIGERLSVKDRMEKIMRLMTSSDIVSFHKLFLKEESTQGVVVSFVSILELAKARVVKIMQAKRGDELYISKFKQS
tara:strand:- start:209 stop:979 length:771 start_codon:yes stop_codon:yes gene_type:complete